MCDARASISNTLKEEKATTNANLEEFKILKEMASSKVLM